MDGNKNELKWGAPKPMMPFPKSENLIMLVVKMVRKIAIDYIIYLSTGIKGNKIIYYTEQRISHSVYLALK